MSLLKGKKLSVPIVILFLEDLNELFIFQYVANSKMLRIRHVHEKSLALTQKLMLGDI
jgi:hypothetical protein